MKRTTCLGVALATAAAALPLVAGPASAATRPAPPVVRIMPLGDSITAGEGSSTRAGYRGPLWDLLGAGTSHTPDFVGSGSFGGVPDPDNEGHSGYTIKNISDGIDRWQKAAAPDTVLLHLGINDLTFHHADPATASAELAALIDRIETNRPGTTVIVQGLLTDTRGQFERTTAFNASLRGSVAERTAAGRHLVYVEPPLLDPPAELPDGLHPSDPGYRKMATAFHEGLQRASAEGWLRRPSAPRAGTESGGTGPVRWADFDGDGLTDRLVIGDSGEVRARLNRPGSGGDSWPLTGRIATGVTTDRTRVRFADFDGDGRADYLYIAADGGVGVHLNRGGDISGPHGWEYIGRVAGGTTRNHHQVRFADHDGDGRADYWTIADNGAVRVHLNRGGDAFGAAGWIDLGQIATGTTTDRTRVRLADYDGDGRADYWTVDPDGRLTAYVNRGGDSHGGWHLVGRTAAGPATDPARVQLADVTADAHADYLLAEPAGGTVLYAFDGGDPSPADWTRLGTIPAAT
ncbi:FG-GAP-like repeat-containing protein [Streptomyces gardneri]|uniref:FG-GAP-like repeat-containing protein n=1 Tax=Streptomyces gardneri TaxID=66892 RepID=UPI0035DDF936